MTAAVDDSRPTVTVDGDTVTVIAPGQREDFVSVSGVQNALVVVEQQNLTTVGAGPSGVSGYTDDLRESMMAAGIDTSTGRIGYNYTEGGVFFATNARYTEETVHLNFQMNHGWIEGSDVHYHIHWLQTENAQPNWLTRYRKIPLGGAPGSWSALGKMNVGKYTYSSGTLHQLNEHPDPAIDMTGMGISSILQVQLWRDTANASGLFAGADPFSTAAVVMYCDCHVLRDSIGSVTEYDKDGI